jgi:hypothetical protein
VRTPSAKLISAVKVPPVERATWQSGFTVITGLKLDAGNSTTRL